MKRYEMIREIFNSCSGNQMRDTFIETVELESPEDKVRIYLDDPCANVTRSEDAAGTVIFDIDISGQKQRFSFTEI